jgi:APA family basic amino acid/polyamine antiporter
MFLWVGSLASLLRYASVGLSIFSMLAVGSVYVLRWKHPDLPRPFRTPGYPFTPLVFLIPTAVLTLAAFSRQAEAAIYAVVSIIIGVPFYYLWIYYRREPATVSTEQDRP